MAGSNCQAGWGKMAQHRLWARHGFYRRGRLRKLAMHSSLWWGWGCLRAQEFLLRAGLSLGVSQVRSEDKMATDLQMVTLLLYHSPIFSLIMMRVGAEDRELG
jgi:hypothetical protein